MFALCEYWLTHLDEKEMKILTEIEIPLAHVLSEMEYNGVCVDVEYLNNLTKELDLKISQIEKSIFELAGESFNINSPKQVAHILFEKLELKSSKNEAKLKIQQVQKF